MRILLTNDDGYDQPGLLELENSLGERHEIWVVAPLHHCSGTSHALGLYSSMELITEGEDSRKWALEGTPTDCVKIALMEIMKDNPPDLLISGINPGSNLSNNILYSGTVAAAMEAALWNIPSIALSVQISAHGEKPLFETASNALDTLLDNDINNKIPNGTIVNVNVPGLDISEIKGWKWTRMAQFSADISFREIEPGRVFAYDRYRSLPVIDPDGTDVDAIQKHYISMTLLDVNRTSTRKPPILELTDGSH
ncbi:MAG: 5'/3'-nucleotidase SurE [Candidatus Aegiribacteria sp.]|nr:5'/3'-nucleotidase SurE [Candidatus Aegiribacteria sp.]